MTDHTSESERPATLDRRTFLKRAGAVGAGAVVASRLSAPGLAGAQDATFRPDPAAKQRRHAALRRAQRARPLRRPSVGHGRQHRSPEPDVRHAAAAQSQGRADDHPRPGAAVGDLARRQEVHVPPAQGREVPRRRRLHRRGRQGHLRPHRASAQGRGHPAHAAVRDGGRHRGGRSAQDRVPADRGAAQGLHAGRLRQRLEHHRAQEDARRQPGQPAPGDELPGHRPLQARLPQGQGSLDHGAQPRLLEQGAAARRQARDLPLACRSRRSSARRSCPARSTTRGCSTRSPGARPRRCRA